ncbi:hypothetical protein [Leptospira ilyithenensis]|uniref:Uncharacterized protein n=1 Tax=Leptospira ilyithenensis TaxID=2484901 RepID=A0A4R9LQF7_9LEPT|nr:hypothetical protein [Leptospira ilyithenensis]TGN08431.1 hypothetical protein EHS11_16170 [Leptospira ilyithenensis]
MRILFANLAQFLRFSVNSIGIVLLGWIHIAHSGSLFLFQFWKRKILLDQIFFILLFLQLVFSALPWFSYEIQFFDSPETVNIGPKWNFLFILVSLLNFFFLGFWKSSWVRIWFFATQLTLAIILIWGYLEPTRYYFDFINEKEVNFKITFYLFSVVSAFSFLFGFLTFQREDSLYD